MSIQPLVTVTLCRWPCRVLVGSSQFVSPDDEHDVLEKYRKLKIKINTWKRIVRHFGHLPTIITSNNSFQILPNLLFIYLPTVRP